MSYPDPSQSSKPSTEALDATILEERHGLWRDGDLFWKLDPMQAALYEQIARCPGGMFATEGARKLGKSFVHGVIVLETAIRNPNKRINWAAINGKEARNTLLPILEEISADAPPECMGRHDAQENQWLMPNGAVIQLFGAATKEDCEKGRGPSSVLSVIDEAGFHDHLEYLYDSVLEPQQRRVKRKVGAFTGMMLLVSTTPYTPAHHFCKMADGASVRGAYAKRTIWDSGFETREEIEAYIARKASDRNMTVEAFVQTTHFRREYLSERVVDEDIVVFPEFYARRDVIVREWERPFAFESYIYKRVSLDLGGMRDKYGWVYGYVDFKAGMLVIEDEKLLAKPNTEQVAREFVEHEAALWPDANPSRIARVIDDDTERLIRDLWDIHKVNAQKAVKQGPQGGRSAAIGMIRTHLQFGTIAIHPRCEQLCHQLLTATRNTQGTDFERTDDGHFDLCAALMYWIREAPIGTQPYPPDLLVATGQRAPAHHPLKARAEALGKGTHSNPLTSLMLGGNAYTAGRLRSGRRR